MGCIDPFTLLGLNENHANIAEARQAYYSLALDTHPDRMAGNADQFRVVHSAGTVVSAQLEGVPDAGEVVGNFEAHKAEWEAFLAAQTDAPLPSEREISDEERAARPRKESGAEGDGAWEHTSVAPRFREAWACAASAGSGGVVWAAFPAGGYGEYASDAPSTGNAEPEIVGFPARHLVVYEAPEPSPDRFSSRTACPTGVVDDLPDYSVNDANPEGADYKIALAPVTGADGSWPVLEDPRTDRTDETFEAERASTLP